MNTIALALAVVCVVASTGLAAWVWLALDGVDDEWRDVGVFEGLHAER